MVVNNVSYSHTIIRNDWSIRNQETNTGTKSFGSSSVNAVYVHFVSMKFYISEISDEPITWPGSP